MRVHTLAWGCPGARWPRSRNPVTRRPQQNCGYTSLTSSGGGNGGGRNVRRYSGGGGDSSPGDAGRGSGRQLQLSTVLAALATWGVTASAPSYNLQHLMQPPHETSDMPVCVVIPALNEEAVLATTLRCVAALEPKPAAVVVSVGPSTDSTAEIARQFGATVVTGDGKKGRAVQMNAGAETAAHMLAAAGHHPKRPPPSISDRHTPPPPAAYLFVHADTRLPPDAVSLVRHALRGRRTMGGGFVALLESPNRTWWAQSFHNTIKTFYLPLLFRPLSFVHGLRILFGDQCVFARSDAFHRVAGFDETVPIMEDADMCLKLHALGPFGIARRTVLGDDDELVSMPGRKVRPRLPRTAPRGRIVLIDRCVATSGRRFDVWGNARATATHVAIALSWYFGASGDRMLQLYWKLYGDIRTHKSS